MRLAIVLGVCSLAGCTAGCHRPASPASPAEDALTTATTERESSPDGAAVEAPAVLPARCHAAGPSWSLAGADAPPGELEIGDAVESAEGDAVALVHRTAAGRTAAVAFVDPSSGDAPAIADAGKAARVVELGPTLGDAPPPRLALRRSDLVAAAYGVPHGGGSGDARELALYTVGPSGATAWLSIPQQRDDSFAFDMAYAGSDGVVVWDEAASAGRGVIRLVALSADPRSGPAHDVSPAPSDAELPRAVAVGPGFVVLWIARRPEPGLASDASELEATGEERAFGWLEMVALDERGAVAGPVRRLTSAGGHVSAYDVQVLAPPSSGAKAPVLVVARDDGAGTDGSGGALVRVRVVGDAIDPPVMLATDGLGRGAPTFVDGQPPWLAWVGPHEQLRLVGLDASGAPTSTPSAEDELNDARPLMVAFGAKKSPGAATMLAAAPSNVLAELRTFACDK